MQEVLTGSEAAAQELFRDYGPLLLHVIRRKLNKKIRPRFDSTDFVQEVWASYFAKEPHERTFASADELVAFLTRLAQNKVTDATRQQLKAQKRNVNREESIDDSLNFDKHQLPGDVPTPSVIVSAREEWRAFLRKQPLLYRGILVMLRDGMSAEEIASTLNIHPRTVKRVSDLYMARA